MRCTDNCLNCLNVIYNCLRPSVRQPVRPSICPSIRLSVHPSVCSSVRLFFSLSHLSYPLSPHLSFSLLSLYLFLSPPPLSLSPLSLLPLSSPLSLIKLWFHDSRWRSWRQYLGHMQHCRWPWGNCVSWSSRSWRRRWRWWRSHISPMRRCYQVQCFYACPWR